MLRHKIYRRLVYAFCCILLSFQSFQVKAQDWAASTNLADWMWFVTVNGGIQRGVSRHVTLEAVAKYNNWTFNKGNEEKQFQSRQIQAGAGMRWWPWHIYSGWWVGTRAQYQQYNRGGFFGITDAEEGDAYGLSLGGGYSIQLNKWLNIDVGLTGWGGYKDYTVYACPYCGSITEKDKKFFFAPNDVMIALMFVF